MKEDDSSSSSSNEDDKASACGMTDAEHSECSESEAAIESEQPVMCDGVALLPKSNAQHRMIQQRMQQQRRQRELDASRLLLSTASGTAEKLDEMSRFGRESSSQSHQKRRGYSRKRGASEPSSSGQRCSKPPKTQPTTLELPSDLNPVRIDPVNNVLEALNRLSDDISDINTKVDKDTVHVKYINEQLDKQMERLKMARLQTDALTQKRSGTFDYLMRRIGQLKDEQQKKILELNTRLGPIEDKLQQQKTELEVIKLQLGDSSPVTSLAKRAVLGAGEVTVFTFKAFLFIVALVRDCVVQPLIASVAD